MFSRIQPALLTLLASLLLHTTSAWSLTIRDVTPGKYVTGPNLSAADMDGKAVLVLFYGVKCVHSNEYIPKLADMYKRNQDLGFHVVAFESSRAEKEAALEAALTKGVFYEVTLGGSIKNVVLQQTPYAYLFSPDGSLVAEGHPLTLDTKIPPLLNETYSYAAPRTIRFLTKLAQNVRDGKDFPTTLKELREKAAGTNHDEAVDAGLILDRLGAIVKTRLMTANAMKDSNPAEALWKLENLNRRFEGDKLSEDALRMAEELKKKGIQAPKSENAAATVKEPTFLVKFKDGKTLKAKKVSDFGEQYSIQSMEGGKLTVVEKGEVEEVIEEKP